MRDGLIGRIRHSECFGLGSNPSPAANIRKNHNGNKEKEENAVYV